MIRIMFAQTEQNVPVVHLSVSSVQGAKRLCAEDKSQPLPHRVLEQYL